MVIFHQINMDTNTFFIILPLGLIAIWGLKIFLNNAQVDRYDYLDHLSFHEWKRAKDLRCEMSRRKKGRISSVNFYRDMSILEDEGYILHKVEEKEIDGIGIQELWYKLKDNSCGRRRRIPSPILPSKQPALSSCLLGTFLFIQKLNYTLKVVWDIVSKELILRKESSLYLVLNRPY